MYIFTIVKHEEILFDTIDLMNFDSFATVSDWNVFGRPYNRFRVWRFMIVFKQKRSSNGQKHNNKVRYKVIQYKAEFEFENWSTPGTESGVFR